VCGLAEGRPALSAAPRLSVGLPVYNGEVYLGQSIESLLGQTYEDFELIISDNASTDATGEICRSYAKQDSRIRYVLQPRNIGLGPNHNFVFSEARGDLFKWAACDDLYARDLLQRCVEALDAHPEVVLAHTWEAVIDESGTVTQALEYPLATDSVSAPQRFRSFLFASSGLFDSPDGGMVRLDNRGIVRSDDEYGVIRSDVLRQISPLGSCHHSDMILVCELALRGAFHMTPEWLYFRRQFPDRSYNASPSVRGRSVILDPARANRLRHSTARLLGEYFWGYLAAIHRAPLSAADRRECYRQIALWSMDRAGCRIVPRPMKPIGEPFSPLLNGREMSVRAVVAGQEEVTR
jgi:glycosyltransferase involved in cell wall biosynthesis